MNMWPLPILVILSLFQFYDLADPDPPHSPTNRPSRPLSQTQDCNGPVAFSGSGGVQHPSKLIGYRQTLAEAGVGWNVETGEFTCHCPGLYQLSFNGVTDANAKLVLKKHSASDNGTSWTPLISTPNGGGFNLILTNIIVGDQFGIWIEGSGGLQNQLESSIHITSFSGFRISKNVKDWIKS